MQEEIGVIFLDFKIFHLQNMHFDMPLQSNGKENVQYTTHYLKINYVINLTYLWKTNIRLHSYYVTHHDKKMLGSKSIFSRYKDIYINDLDNYWAASLSASQCGSEVLLWNEWGRLVHLSYTCYWNIIMKIGRTTKVTRCTGQSRKI